MIKILKQLRKGRNAKSYIPYLTERNKQTDRKTGRKKRDFEK